VNFAPARSPVFVARDLELCQFNSDHDVTKNYGRILSNNQQSLAYLKLGEQKVKRGRSQLTRNQQTTDWTSHRQHMNSLLRFTD